MDKGGKIPRPRCSAGIEGENCQLALYSLGSQSMVCSLEVE